MILVLAPALLAQVLSSAPRLEDCPLLEPLPGPIPALHLSREQSAFESSISVTVVLRAARACPSGPAPGAVVPATGVPDSTIAFARQLLSDFLDHPGLGDHFGHVTKQNYREEVVFQLQIEPKVCGPLWQFYLTVAQGPTEKLFPIADLLVRADGLVVGDVNELCDMCYRDGIFCSLEGADLLLHGRQRDGSVVAWRLAPTGSLEPVKPLYQSCGEGCLERIQ